MNVQDAIITPEIAKSIAGKVFAAAHAARHRSEVVERLLTDIRTALRDEIAATHDLCRYGFARREVRTVFNRLSSISPRRSLPRVKPTPELTQDIVAYCAQAPRTFMQIRRRIRLRMRVENRKTTAMVRAWEREGVIRNVGTGLAHQWVACAQTSPQSSDARG